MLAQTDRKIAIRDRVADLGVGDEHLHSIERNRDLLATSQHSSHHAWQEAQPSEVCREDRQLADAELPGRHRARSGEQHQSESDVRGALAEGPDAFVENAVAHGSSAPFVDQLP